MKLFIPYQDLLVKILDKYTFLGSVSMAVFLIYLGIQKEEKLLTLEKGARVTLKHMLMFLPCPLCMVALALSVILLGPLLNISPEILGWCVSGVFFGLLIAIAFVLQKLMDFFSFGHSSVLNNFLLFLGIVTLSCGLFVPNFVESMSMPSSSLMPQSSVWTGLSVLGVTIIICTIGYLKYTLYDRKGE